LARDGRLALLGQTSRRRDGRLPSPLASASAFPRRMRVAVAASTSSFAAAAAIRLSGAAAPAAELGRLRAQGRNPPGRLFGVANRENPLLTRAFAILGDAGGIVGVGLLRRRLREEIVAIVHRRTTAADQIAHVDRLGLADDYVVAARRKRIAGL